MKKNVLGKSFLLSILLLMPFSSIQAFSPLQLLKDHPRITFAACCIISVTLFIQSYNLLEQRDSLLKSVFPNFDQMMNQLIARCTTYREYERSWKNFLETQIKPINPDLLSQIESLDRRSHLFGVGGIVFAASLLFRIEDGNEVLNKRIIDVQKL